MSNAARPDRLTAIASAAYNRGATTATHNLGGLHADIHHCGGAPERLPEATWAELLARHAS